MENNQSAARAAKRFLDDRVRTDWAYPQVPPPWEHSDEEVRAAVEFRERYYGESDSSDSDMEPATGATKDAAHDAYKFDSPDAIAAAVDRTRETRRKRRRLLLEAEMAENPGLRIWVERRDAWTGASSVRKYGTRVLAQSPSPPALPAHDSSTADAPPPPDTFDTCPVAPRLLADNPIRQSIGARAYTDIYAKIVTSSRTPSVPINLADMTRALVQGWKDTNEWPPKMGPIDPLAGKKRSIGGVLGGGRDGLGRAEGGFIHRHPHLEKGVGSVKKILHLNGHHAGGEGVKEG